MVGGGGGGHSFLYVFEDGGTRLTSVCNMMVRRGIKLISVSASDATINICIL